MARDFHHDFDAYASHTGQKGDPGSLEELITFIDRHAVSRFIAPISRPTASS
jgi:hypothetical protein